MPTYCGPARILAAPDTTPTAYPLATVEMQANALRPNDLTGGFVAVIPANYGQSPEIAPTGGWRSHPHMNPLGPISSGWGDPYNPTSTPTPPPNRSAFVQQPSTAYRLQQQNTPMNSPVAPVVGPSPAPVAQLQVLAPTAVSE